MRAILPYGLMENFDMSRKAKTNGSTALATVETALPVLQITRAKANARIKARALELYHAA